MDRFEDGLSKEACAAIAKKGYHEPDFFLKFFLNSKFPKDIPWVHLGIIAIITRKTKFLLKYPQLLEKIETNFLYKEDGAEENGTPQPLFLMLRDEKGSVVSITLVEKKNTLIMLPRGFSKTTLVGIGLMLWKILYKETKFIVYVSETGTHAEMQLENVKRELSTNQRIKLIFGDLVPDRTDLEKWTQGFIETRTGVAAVARGRGSQIRGLLHNGTRPDTLLFDDLEDRESVSTDTQRKKTRDWFYGDFIPAIAEMEEKSAIYGLGTLLHEDALLTYLIRDPEWAAVRFGALDLQGDPIWALALDKEKLEKKKRSYTLAGDLASYFREYFNEIRNEALQKFQSRMFRYEVYTIDQCVARAIALDPAISQKEKADFAAMAVVGMTDKGHIPVLDMWFKRGATAREQIDAYFELSKRWQCNLHGIESVAFQASLIHLVREEMFRKKHYFEVTPITHSKKKEERIEGVLVPRLSAGYVTFNRRFPELEVQLLGYMPGKGQGEKKDGPDVLAMAITLLDPYAAQAGMDGKDMAEDEYEPLDNVFKGPWRAH